MFVRPQLMFLAAAVAACCGGSEKNRKETERWGERDDENDGL